MGKAVIPVSKRLEWAVKQILAQTDAEREEPIQIEPALSRQYAPRFERESADLIARNVWEKQMRYEESDRYETTMALRYGL